MYILVNNDTIKYPYSIKDLRIDNPQISFPETITEEVLAEFDVYSLYDSEKPPFDEHTQRLVNITPIKENDKWMQPWVVMDLSYDEILVLENIEATEVRANRNQLLTECDWTQGKDILDEISLLWATYRQALRDIPSQEGFPWNVTWPEKPE